jgi:hypothetical protein
MAMGHGKASNQAGVNNSVAKENLPARTWHSKCSLLRRPTPASVDYFPFGMIVRRVRDRLPSRFFDKLWPIKDLQHA